LVQKKIKINLLQLINLNDLSGTKKLKDEFVTIK